MLKLNTHALKLEKARKEYTTIRLAEESGVSIPAINKAMKTGRVQDVTAGKLAKVLGVDVSEIVTP